MPRDLQELNAIFKRGMAVSLGAAGVLLIVEMVRLPAAGALKWLDATEVARLATYIIGPWALAAVAIGTLENLVVAFGSRLIRSLGGSWAAEPLSLAAVLLLLSPLARITLALVENTALACCLIGAPVLATVAGIAHRRPWRGGSERRKGFSPALLASAIPTTAIVFWLLDAHLIVERLSSSRYFALSVAYFAGLMICEIGLTFVLYLCVSWKAEGRLNLGPRNRRLLPLWVVALAAAGAAASAVDHLFLPNLYPEFHLFLKIGVYLVAEAAVILIADRLGESPSCLPSRRRGRPVLRVAGTALGLLSAACAVHAAAFCDAASPAWSVAAARSFTTSAIIDFERTLFDLDRDGYSAAFDGNDCDNFDAAANPGEAEIPGNGIDDNCHAGDLTVAQIDRLDRNLRARRRQSSEWWARHPSNPHRRFNVILLTIDSIRADHMGFMGYQRKTTPNLDALAAKSIIFNNAYCQGGWTSISIPSIIKGLNPSRILFSKVYEDRHARLWFPGEIPSDDVMLQMFTVPALDKNLSIAEMVSRSGYRTVALLNDDFTDYFQRRFGYTAGFDTYYSNNTAQSIRNVELKRRALTARQVTEQAVRELMTLEEGAPFFMWIHHFDPHGPHMDTSANVWGRAAIDRYDGEIAYTDAQLGALLTALEQRGLTDSTIIVVTGDHGEAFGEHGHTFHGTSVYQEQIHVPLVFHVPGIAPRIVETNAAHVDIVPTILDLVGIDADVAFDGQSLVRQIIGEAGTDDQRPVYSMTWRYNLAGWRVIDQRALIIGKTKLIYDRLNPRYELYDLAQDPAETANLTGSAPDRFAKIRDSMLMHLETDDLNSIVDSSSADAGPAADGDRPR